MIFCNMRVCVLRNGVMNALTIDLYQDGADIGDMKNAYALGRVQGFTTNPTLMRKAGVTDYAAFARDAIAAIPDLPISFEVFSDDFASMEREARIIAGWGGTPTSRCRSPTRAANRPYP